MSVTFKILRAITNIILPKYENDDLPTYIIYCPKELAIKINDEEPPDKSERSESAYYLLTNDIICRKCGYEICIPLGEIPEELYIGCNGDRSCFHDFEPLIDKEKSKIKASWVEITSELHFEELIKTKNIYEGIFYFKDSWWKIKSGKYVYTIHLDKIINTD